MHILPVPFLSKYLEKPLSSLEKCLILVCTSQEFSAIITLVTEHQMCCVCPGKGALEIKGTCLLQPGHWHRARVVTLVPCQLANRGSQELT